MIVTSAIGLTAGILLAAIQYVPLARQRARRSAASCATDDFWAFHPLALIELVVPHFFGDYFKSHLRELAWMVALNSQRDPFYYSMYVGVPIALAAGCRRVLGPAAHGVLDDRARRLLARLVRSLHARLSRSGDTDSAHSDRSAFR